jgi:hypothetical protein
MVLEWELRNQVIASNRGAYCTYGVQFNTAVACHYNRSGEICQPR